MGGGSNRPRNSNACAFAHINVRYPACLSDVMAAECGADDPQGLGQGIRSGRCVCGWALCRRIATGACETPFLFASGPAGFFIRPVSYGVPAFIAIAFGVGFAFPVYCGPCPWVPFAGALRLWRCRLVGPHSIRFLPRTWFTVLISQHFHSFERRFKVEKAPSLLGK